MQGKVKTESSHTENCLVRMSNVGWCSTNAAVSTKECQLTSRPALLLCLFISLLADFFFPTSVASTNRSEYRRPKPMSRLHPPHFQVASNGFLLNPLSQSQFVDFPPAQASVMAVTNPAAVIAWMNADSRVPGIKPN